MGKQTEMTNGSWGLAKKEYYYNSTTKKRAQISMSQTQHKLKVKSQMMSEETKKG